MDMPLIGDQDDPNSPPSVNFLGDVHTPMFEQQHYHHMMQQHHLQQHPHIQHRQQ